MIESTICIKPNLADRDSTFRDLVLFLDSIDDNNLFVSLVHDSCYCYNWSY